MTTAGNDSTVRQCRLWDTGPDGDEDDDYRCGECPECTEPVLSRAATTWQEGYAAADNGRSENENPYLTEDAD